MSQGARNCPLFHVDSAPSRCRSQQQIGLPAEKGRNLQDIDHLCHDLSLVTLVDIREHWHTHFVFDALRIFTPMSSSWPRKETMAIWFVIRDDLKIKGNVEALADRHHLLGHLQGKIFGLNDTGTTNQRERMILANAEGLGNTRVYHGLAPRCGLGLPPASSPETEVIQAEN